MLSEKGDVGKEKEDEVENKDEIKFMDVEECKEKVVDERKIEVKVVLVDVEEKIVDDKEYSVVKFGVSESEVVVDLEIVKGDW